MAKPMYSSFEIIHGKYPIFLSRDHLDGVWFIARRKQGFFEVFNPHNDDTIWDRQVALTEGDPIRLLQLFTLAHSCIVHDRPFAAFLRSNHEHFVSIIEGVPQHVKNTVEQGKHDLTPKDEIQNLSKTPDEDPIINADGGLDEP